MLFSDTFSVKNVLNIFEFFGSLKNEFRAQKYNC